MKITKKYFLKNINISIITILFNIMTFNAYSQNNILENDTLIINFKDVKIYNLSNINSKDDEISPIILKDGLTLYFASNRSGSISNYDGFTYDFWNCSKSNNYDTIFTLPFNIDSTNKYNDLGLNSTKNEGAGAVTLNEKYFFFTSCNRINGFGDCDLYVSELINEEWGKAKNLGRKINSPYWDSQPTITTDNSRIYFVSNRPGPNGYANMDIWYSDFNFEKNEWLPAKNLEEINSPGKEYSPFIFYDNKTLFFATNGWKPNFGGLDIWYSKLDLESGTWSIPINLGKSINSKEDDCFPFISQNAKLMYFSSKRKDISGYKGGYDIFMAILK